MDIVDLESEASEEYEDFHPSNLLEVVVKETDNSETDLKNDYYSSFSGEPSSDLFSGFHYLNPSPVRDNNDFQHQKEEPKKALYWRVCSLCKFREIGGKDTVYSYHRFPLDRSLCQHWKKICNFSDSVDVSHLKLCSRHFTKDDFFDPDAKNWGHSLKLKPRAVPSQNIPSTSTSGQSLPRTSGQQENLIKSATSTSLQSITGLDVVNKQLIAPVLIREENKMHGNDVSSSFGISNERLLPTTNAIDQEDSEPKEAVPSKPNKDVDLDNDSTSDVEKSNGNQKSENGWKKKKLYYRYCYLCEEFKDQEEMVSLHKFPHDTQVNRLWKKVCNLIEHDYMNTSSLLICSNHFVDDDYIGFSNEPGCPRILKPSAVPSISVPNPLKTFESSEPGTVEKRDVINSPDIVEVTLEPVKAKKQIVNPVKVNISKKNDISNQSDSPGKFQGIFKALPKPEDFLPHSKSYHHIIHNQKIAVQSKNTKSVSNPNGHVGVRDPKQSNFSQFKLVRPALSEGAVPKVQPTMENTSTKIPVFFSNSANYSRPMRILHTYSGPRLPLAPTVTYAPPVQNTPYAPRLLAPPGLFVHPQTLRKPAQVIDGSTQTLAAAAWQVEQSCQTDAECNEGDDMANEVIELDDSPPLKKRRLSLSSAESSSSESTEPKQAWKEGQLKRLRDRNMVEEQMNRIKQRINSLDDLLCHLQKRDLLSKDAADFLMNLLLNLKKISLIFLWKKDSHNGELEKRKPCNETCTKVF
ncbi:Uncharacterized protein GBIM_20247 [Gryllus bimaculatus]|nr:Uncharacterized protein GBIM_20247 [Gryllus bimaculatus]